LIEYPQSVPNLTAMSMNLYELLKGSNLAAYVDDEIRLAMQRAVAVETSRGMKITKEKASHKIDIVVALAMAALGAVEHRPKPPAASASADPPVGGYHADRRAVLAGFGRRRF
jgi:phage terminase large subunit-like protein